MIPHPHARLFTYAQNNMPRADELSIYSGLPAYPPARLFSDIMHERAYVPAFMRIEQTCSISSTVTMGCTALYVLHHCFAHLPA